MRTFALVLMAVVFVLAAVTLYYYKKFFNPYKLYMVFGKKGAGKSTYLTMLAVKYAKAGRPVYSTLNVPYAYKLDYHDIGFKSFPPDAVLLIDEVGMIWDNRNFKNFKNEVRDYFKLQRHYRHTVYLFSQSFDVDLKLRTLTDRMYLLVNPMGWFTYIRSITRSITVTEASSQAESRIADQLHLSGLAGLLFGSSKIMLIPKYAKYFDSFVVDELPPSEDQRWENEYQIFRRKERLRMKKSVNNQRCKRKSLKSWLSEGLRIRKKK